jgi:hypothetical protein
MIGGETQLEKNPFTINQRHRPRCKIVDRKAVGRRVSPLRETEVEANRRRHIGHPILIPGLHNGLGPHTPCSCELEILTVAHYLRDTQQVLSQNQRFRCCCVYLRSQIKSHDRYPNLEDSSRRRGCRPQA